MEKDFINSLAKIIERDLNQLEKEISLYANESSLWEIKGEIKNPGGNLCLHLCGNLQHFIGTLLGHTGYIRNRDNEFSAKGVLREQLLREIQKTKKDVLSTLEKLDPAVLKKEYPLQVLGYPMTTTYFLVHLVGHLNYHLGQVNYHRRLLPPSA